MRRVLSELFSRNNGIDKYMSKNCSIDPRVAPADLLEQLKQRKKMNKFIGYLNQSEKNGLKMLNKLTVIHFCLIHAPQLCLSLTKVDFKQVPQDQWLTEYIIKPYQTFLSKLCFSYELYNLIKSNKVIDFTFDNLFYSLQLLKCILQCSKKISNLHHYYHKQAAKNHPFALRNFVMMLAYHSQQAYSIFKAILSEFIRFPQRYIIDLKAENIVKYILQVQLARLNESMRQLFLNSFFFPYGKGLGVKLLHIEQLPDQTREFAQSILYPNTQKIKKKKFTMDSILFDRGGKLNSDIYNGLQQISMGQEGIIRGQEILNTAIQKKLKNYIESIESV